MSSEMSVVLIAILGPVIMAAFTSWNIRAGKREDYKRQDLVAERAEKVAQKAAEAAELLAGKQDAIAAQTREVAQQADKAAVLLLAKQNSIENKTIAVADSLISSDRIVADVLKQSNEAITGKLDVIHTLVNSTMTAAMQAELDATNRELHMLREVVELRRAATGKEPSTLTLAAITTAENRIEELEALIAERHKQDAIANAQLVKIVEVQRGG